MGQFGVIYMQQEDGRVVPHLRAIINLEPRPSVGGWGVLVLSVLQDAVDFGCW